MKLHLVASQPHYADHLRPIWEQMPESVKGDEFLGNDVHRWAQRGTDVALLAGYADVQHAPGLPYIYVEHGAGQSYLWPPNTPVADGSYSGGRGHNHCIGFICPNSDVAMRWFNRYPSTPSAVVGSPRLDPWHAGARGEPENGTVAITFHWDALFTGVQETASAFGWYLPGLFDLIRGWRAQGRTVLGHWHPRYPAIGQEWDRLNRQLGMEVVSDAAQVLDRASILVADNTSMQAEFLSLGRPVVWLNHPGYRRDVHHGGRFWTWPRTFGGTEVDGPQDLLRLDLDSVQSPTGHPYAFADGMAAARASLAIQYWLRTFQGS